MTPQELQFELMKASSFNQFDGEAVVKSLQENRELWEAALIDRANYSKVGEIDGIKLRDLPDYYNVDTLYIRAVKGKEKELEALANTWSADEVSYQDIQWHGPALRVWWD